jgi:hypothetical protein
VLGERGRRIYFDKVRKPESADSMGPKQQRELDSAYVTEVILYFVLVLT